MRLYAINAPCSSPPRDALLEWLAEVRQTLVQRHWTGVISRIADDLIVWPAINVSFVTSTYGVSQPSRESAIDRLIEIGALRELTGRKYARVYGATDVIKIVQEL